MLFDSPDGLIAVAGFNDLKAKGLNGGTNHIPADALIINQ